MGTRVDVVEDCRGWLYFTQYSEPVPDKQETADLENLYFTASNTFILKNSLWNSEEAI